ncbi:hypothetical protein EX30DRAFT_270662 [Ascodesmis nigricans]|uniref:RBR-type E3 ubiquitin transferase n=1 Tax=Ascodesmis nigricans TaxID=341454 RepID=A0A4S2MX29_9PEZI|nr:hypothetical protein EX30DRAFT_270662 [Ascodesmis nigricans]
MAQNELSSTLLAELIGVPEIADMSLQEIQKIQDLIAIQARYEAEASSHRPKVNHPKGAPPRERGDRARAPQRQNFPARRGVGDAEQPNNHREQQRAERAGLGQAQRGILLTPVQRVPREGEPANIPHRNRPVDDDDDEDDLDPRMLNFLEKDLEFSGIPMNELLALQNLALTENGGNTRRRQNHQAVPEPMEDRPHPQPQQAEDDDYDDNYSSTADEKPTADLIPEGPPPQRSDGITECAACMEVIPGDSLTFICPCSHIYCKVCITGILDAVFDRGRLPAECCQKPIGLAAVRAALDSGRFKKYKDRVEELTAKPDELLYCCRPQCTARVILTKAQIKRKKLGRIKAGEKDGVRGTDTAQCTKCSSWTCVRCKKAMHKGSCWKDKDEEALKKFAKKKGLRICPHCKNLIEKTGNGCAVIHCTCGNHFCWNCGKAKPLGGSGYEGEDHGGCNCRIFGNDDPMQEQAQRMMNELPPDPGQGFAVRAGHRRYRRPDGGVELTREVPDGVAREVIHGPGLNIQVVFAPLPHFNDPELQAFAQEFRRIVPLDAGQPIFAPPPRNMVPQQPPNFIFPQGQNLVPQPLGYDHFALAFQQYGPGQPRNPF